MRFEPVKQPKDWEMKDIFEKVFLNQYGYYELRKQNTAEERGKNLAHHQNVWNRKRL